VTVFFVRWAQIDLLTYLLTNAGISAKMVTACTLLSQNSNV